MPINSFGKVLQGFIPDMKPLDNISEEVPFLMAMGARPANAGDKHLYTEVVEASELKQLDVNEAFPEVSATFSEDYAEVNRFGGELSVTRDDALKLAQAKGMPGNLREGVNLYFDDQEAEIEKQTFMAIEKAVFYASKRGILAASKAFGTMVGIQPTDATPNKYYSLTIISPNDHTALIYDPNFYAGQKLFKETPLNSIGADGQPIPTKRSLDGVMSVGKAMETTLGTLFVDKRTIATIVNFTLDDIDADFFKIVNKQLAKCRGTRKYLVAHPDVINLLGEAQEAKTYSVGNGGTNEGTDNQVYVQLWKSATMIETYNLLEGAEPFQTGL